MENKNEILSLFHHIHHFDNKHEVHHCGGRHASIDPKLNYEIKHCVCNKHSINKEITIGHATDTDLCPVEVMIKFLERCPCGGWHVESGIKINNDLKLILPDKSRQSLKNCLKYNS